MKFYLFGRQLISNYIDLKFPARLRTFIYSVEDLYIYLIKLLIKSINYMIV